LQGWLICFGLCNLVGIICRILSGVYSKSFDDTIKSLDEADIDNLETIGNLSPIKYMNRCSKQRNDQCYNKELFKFAKRRFNSKVISWIGFALGFILVCGKAYSYYKK
jgi:hypothetical protein